MADEYKNNYFTSFCQLTQSGVNNIHATIKIGYANALSLGTNRKKKELVNLKNIVNSSKDRLVKQMIQEQRAQKHQNTLYEKVRTIIAEEFNIKVEAAVIMKKSEWKGTVKDNVQIQERVEKEMENKTKLRTVREDKLERKQYIATCDSDLVKDIIKIRLHM